MEHTFTAPRVRAHLCGAFSVSLADPARPRTPLLLPPHAAAYRLWVQETCS